MTPIMARYHELKSQAPDCLLFYRMGDFYELFDDDAVEASKLLEITLTARDKKSPNPTPMAGVPFHAAQNYIQKILNLGRKVAIAEQFVDTVAGKEVIRREIVRVLTPAIQFESQSTQPQFLATIQGLSAAVLDSSTGEVRVGSFTSAENLEAVLGGLPIRHYLCVETALPKGWSADSLASLSTEGAVLVESVPAHALTLEPAEKILKEQYAIASLHAWLPIEDQRLALGRLIRTVLKTQKLDRLPHLRHPLPLLKNTSLWLGPKTALHLDLIPSGDGTPHLFGLLNRTKTSMGARELRSMMLEPLKEPAAILERQGAIRELFDRRAQSSRLETSLAQIYDLERILGRVHTGLANPRDTYALGSSLSAVDAVAQSLEGHESKSVRDLCTTLRHAGRDYAELRARILKTQKPEAPFHDRDGGIFEMGADPELDRLLSLGQNGEKWLLELEAREKSATGISTLKVRYNRVFGYYIEITASQLKNVPEHYQRKQTMVGAERFFTDELKKFEDEFLTATSRQEALEKRLFQELLTAIRAQTAPIMIAAKTIAEIDALFSLSRLLESLGWNFPVIDETHDLEITDGRHPLVDQAFKGNFVPNSLSLNALDRQILLVTGPNMGGKSTLMRQVALIVILGQMGAPVPATQARWGIFDSVFTRIGAHDAIAQGQSTFMVEMSELSLILNQATSRSLIILDEIGRGTSTYDGISVAWSALEWIHHRISARTLFATHYHELTELGVQLPKTKNAHMGVEGGRGDKNFRFQYRLCDGPANDSFGIQVAKLAGLPKPVIDRAWKILARLESTHAETRTPHPQLSLFTDLPGNPASEEVAPHLEPGDLIRKRLDEIDINDLTPRQALELLFEFKTELKSDAARVDVKSLTVLRTAAPTAASLSASTDNH